jgi:hypothetical protein
MSHEAYLRCTVTEPDGNGDCKVLFNCASRGQRSTIMHKNSGDIIRCPHDSLTPPKPAPFEKPPEAYPTEPVAPSFSETDLKEMTLPQLRAFAAKHDLRCTKSWNVLRARTELAAQIEAMKAPA